MSDSNTPKLIKIGDVIFNPASTILFRFAPPESETLFYRVRQGDKARDIEGDDAVALDWWVNENSVDVVAKYKEHQAGA